EAPEGRGGGLGQESARAPAWGSGAEVRACGKATYGRPRGPECRPSGRRQGGGAETGTGWRWRPGAGVGARPPVGAWGLRFGRAGGGGSVLVSFRGQIT